MKATKKDLRNNYFYVIRAGYCELQNLTRNAREIGRGSGVYGWNWTAYELEATDGVRVCICTGYRDLTGSDIKGKSQFEKEAENICKNRTISWEEMQKQLKALQARFADYCIKTIKGE